MDVLSQCIWILLQILICESMDIKPEFYEKNEEICKKQAKDPYFDINVVVGQPWTVYYTWNINMRAKCIDFIFKNATKRTVKRMQKELSEYMEEQPYWEKEALLLSTKQGSTSRQLLLFADQGPAGRFRAVPNIRDTENFELGIKRIPLLRFMVKLVANGNYLLLLDCFIGGASLATRQKNRPYRVEVATTVASLDLGDGHHACTGQTRKGEQLMNIE